MKGTLCIFLILACHSSAAQLKSEETKVQEAITTVFDGIAHANFPEIKSVLADDFILLEHGEVWNQDSVSNIVARVGQKKVKRINMLDFQKTEILGNTAYVYYWNTADISFNNETRRVRWLESAVLIKKNGAWKIQLLHSTRIDKH